MAYCDMVRSGAGDGVWYDVVQLYRYSALLVDLQLVSLKSSFKHEHSSRMVLMCHRITCNSLVWCGLA